MRFIYIFLLISINLFSQTGKTFMQSWINEQSGLKQNSIISLVQDNNGFLWIATEMGLYVFDGKYLREVNDPKFSDIPFKRIFLSKDSKTGEIVFIVNPNGGIFKVNNQRIEQLFETNQAQKRRDLLTQQKLYFSTTDSLVNRVFLLNEKYDSSNKHEPYFFLSRMCSVGNKLYVPSKTHIYIFERGKKPNKIKYACSRNTSLITFQSKVFLIDSDKVCLIDENYTLRHFSVDSVLKDYIFNYLGSYLSITYKYIYEDSGNYFIQFKGKIYQLHLRSNQLVTSCLFDSPYNELTSICYDKKNQIYFLGTITHGVQILKPSFFNTIKFNNSKLNNVYSVIPLNDSVWASSSGWIHNIRSNSSFTFDNQFSLNTSFILQHKQSYYFNGNFDLINFSDFKKRNPFFLKETKGNYNSFCFFKGTYWLSSEQALFYLSNRKLIKDEFFSNYLTGRQIQRIEPYQQTLLIATTKGVLIYNTKKKVVNFIKGLENVYARYIKFVNKDSFWLGCYGDGLFLVTPKRVYKVLDSNLQITSAHAIEEDNLGNLWISSNQGLYRVNKKEALKCITSNKPISSYIYTVEDGLLTNEFNGGGTFPSLSIRDKILGFSGIKGYVWFEPKFIKKHLFDEKIIVTHLKADTLQIQENKGVYTIPRKTNLISINFSFPYFFNRENLNISYKFGDQKNWTKVNTNVIQLERIRDGRQKLIIRISTNGYNKDKNVYATYTLDFEPRYYETFLFWSILICLFLLLFYTTYSLGLNYQRKTKLLLEQRIEERTALLKEIVLELENSNLVVTQSLHEKELLIKEVHHRVKNNLQLIISMLHIQARRKNFKDIHEFLEKSETRINAMALLHQRLYQNESELHKINIQLYLDDLVQSISQSFANDDGRLSFRVSSTSIELNLSTAIPLGLIINEIVTNSFKHGFPGGRIGFIDIKLIKIKEYYCLVVKDNGVGFEITPIKSSSFGLELIKLLTLQLQGDVTFESTDGTKCIIRFKEIDL